MDDYLSEEERVEALKKWWQANSSSVLWGLVLGFAVPDIFRNNFKSSVRVCLSINPLIGSDPAVTAWSKLIFCFK